MNIISEKKRAISRMLLKQIGAIQILLGLILFFPALVSLMYGEHFSALGFTVSSIIIVIIGYALYKFNDPAPEPLSRHALIIAALSWLSIACLGSIPFFVIAHVTPLDIAQQYVPAGADYNSSLFFFQNPINALFESMSAFTTTGLTMAVHEPSIGKGLLFYRSLAQWIGGAGFIVLALAVLRQSSGKAAMLLYGSESSGERLHPTIMDTARSIWKIYLGLTLFSSIILIVGSYFILPDYNLKENIFDSINHAMTGQSTGGFSTLDESIAGYNSRAMEILYMLPMLLGALSIPFYFKVIYQKQFNQFWKNIQTRSIFIASAIGGILLSLLLIESGTSSEPFREGIFQFISAITTTGWQTANINTWDSSSVVFIVMTAMIVGGAAGATVGGIKIIRVLLILKGVQWHINSFFVSENVVQVVEFNQKRLLPKEMNKELASAGTFSFLYLILVLFSTIITYFYMGQDYTITDALFESASAQGTVGLSCGITGPSMSTVLKITYFFQMWIGRLEIIPVLVLLRTIIWGTKAKVV